MVKSKKVSKKGDATLEAEEPTEVNNEEVDNTSQENGVEDNSNKKKAVKGKSKDKKEKSEEDVEEKEETDDVVENGEDGNEKKKPAKTTKRPAKKEPKPQVEPARKSSRTPKPVTKEGDAEAAYEVEKIVSSRLVNGNPQYLVRWKGYSRGDDTWEDEQDLNNCPELLQKYKSENPGSGKKAKKRPSKSPVKASAAKKTKKVEKDYEVEQIVGLRIKNGKKEFKIRWKGYKESDDSWEPEKHLSCQELIESYLKEHGDEVQAEEKKTPAKKAAKKTKTPAKSKAKKSKRK